GPCVDRSLERPVDLPVLEDLGFELREGRLGVHGRLAAMRRLGVRHRRNTFRGRQPRSGDDTPGSCLAYRGTTPIARPEAGLSLTAVTGLPVRVYWGFSKPVLPEAPR